VERYIGLEVDPDAETGAASKALPLVTSRRSYRKNDILIRAAKPGYGGIAGGRSQRLDELVTVTDDHGRFRIEDSRLGHHRVLVARDGSGARGVADVSDRRSSGLKGLEIRLQPTARVHGRVLGALGRPFSGAEVGARCTNDMTFVWMAITHDDGAFELAEVSPGGYRISAFAEPSHYVAVDLNVPADREVVSVELRFPAVGAVTGRVGGLSTVQTRSTGVLVDGSKTGGVDKDARFRIDGLSVGEHEIVARLHWGPTEKTTLPVTFTIERDGHEVDLELEFSTLPGLSGKAQCGSVGAADMRVEISGPSNRATTTDDNGQWRVADLEQGYYTVDFLGSNEARVAGEELYLDRDTHLVTEVPCLLLRGRVVTPYRLPVPGAEVWLDVMSSGLRAANARSDERGSFTLSDLPPGSYTLAAAVGDHSSEDYSVELLDSSGHAEIVLDADKGLALHVWEPSGEPARRVKIHPMVGDRVIQPLWSDCSEEGLCRFEDLDLGIYDLLVKGWYGSAVLQVTVPSAVVPVRLQTEGILEIRLAPEVPDQGHMVRVLTTGGIGVPPASFLDRQAWQPLHGLITMDLPPGGYVVELRTELGRHGSVGVEVSANGRAGAMVQPEPERDP